MCRHFDAFCYDKFHIFMKIFIIFVCHIIYILLLDIYVFVFNRDLSSHTYTHGPELIILSRLFFFLFFQSLRYILMNHSCLFTAADSFVCSLYTMRMYIYRNDRNYFYEIKTMQNNIIIIKKKMIEKITRAFMC